MTASDFSTYAGPSDLGPMADAVSETWRALGADSQVHLGNMSWRLSHIDLRRPSPDIGLWRAPSGRVVGLALVYDIFPLDVFLHADALGHGDLLAEMLDWVELHWTAATKNDGTSERPLRIGCLESDQARITALERRGYEKAAKSYLRLTAPVEPKSFSPLPPELTLRDFNVSQDAATLTALHNAIFTHTRLSSGRVARSASTPWWDPGLSLVVEHETEGLIGFAFGWLDRNSGALEFEPVACRADWRRRGIGRALLETIKARAHDRGACIAALTAPGGNVDTLAFYHALGFVRHGRELEYVKAAA